MRFDPDRHHRRSIRLAGYDYTQPGWYFVTICTYQRLCLFDDPKLCGIAQGVWRALPRFDPCVQVDEWIVMPNHVHGIIIILDRAAKNETGKGDTGAAPSVGRLGINVPSGSLGAIVRSYKGVVTRRANRLRYLDVGPIWQRGFWEHVIRDEQELHATRRYIQENPRRWAEDRDNLDALLARMSGH